MTIVHSFREGLSSLSWLLPPIRKPVVPAQGTVLRRPGKYNTKTLVCHIRNRSSSTHLLVTKPSPICWKWP